MTETGLSYRRSAIEGASPLGLMIALLDTLVGDFHRAAAALRRDDIETRCKEMNHAALVLGQIDNWIDLKNGGEFALTLAMFYGQLRAKMLEAAAKMSAEILDAQIETILEVRTAWQRMDTSPAQSAPGWDEIAVGQGDANALPAPQASQERIRFSQSA